MIRSDRIVGLVILAISIWYGMTARTYEAGFGDPLGPAALPLMLSIPAALLSLGLILRPDPEPEWVVGGPMLRQVAAVAILAGYIFLLDTLGFLLVTFLAVTLLGRLMMTTWPKAALAGIATSLVLYGVFDWLLGLPLRIFPSFMS